MDSIKLTKIDDIDIITNFIELYDELQNITVPVNSHRKDTAGTGRTTTCGLVYRFINKDIVYGRLNKYPRITDLLHEIGYKLGLEFTTIQINHNYICKPHKDCKNSGKQYLISFGDYEGGHLNIKDPATDLVTKVDAYLKVLEFDGINNTHWNEKNTGNKYSIVFYSCKNVLRIMNNTPKNQ